MNRKVLSCVALFCIFGALPVVAAKAKKSDQTMFHSGEELPDNFYPEGYNASAKYEIRNNNRWPQISNITLSVSCLYWNAQQDGMDLATSADLTVSGGDPLTIANKKSEVLHQNFEYQPGFKVGLGCGWKDWDFQATYTWLRQNSEMTSKAPEEYTLQGTPVWVPDRLWFAQNTGSFNTQGILGIGTKNLASEWRVHIDWVDATASRPFYRAKNIVISPNIGLRTMWIRQALNISAPVPTSLGIDNLSHQPLHSRNLSNAWGIGPVVGASGHCFLGKGVRIEATGGASFLYTYYTKLRHSENSISSVSNPHTYRISGNGYDCVRPTANLGLGLGWGSYFYNQLFHVDFLATYDFNVLWGQNMMQKLMQTYNGFEASPGNLFLQGLSVTGKIDF